MQKLQETQVWPLDWEDPLQKGMATYSSIFVLGIPWTEEPGGATVHGVTNSQTRLKCLKTQGDLMKLHAHRSGKPTPGKEGNHLQP